MTQIGELTDAFVQVIDEADQTIGENRDYGPGIGPHDEDDQIDKLVKLVQERDLLDWTIYTASSDSGEVRYPGGQSADLVINTGDEQMYCEAKLFRFQKANENPSTQGFSKVFNPYQDHSPRSFIHDVVKLAESDIRAKKTFLGIYYRPVNGAGTQITSQEIADKFAGEVNQWTDYSIGVERVATFSGLQHPVHTRGGVLTWSLDNQPEQYF